MKHLNRPLLYDPGFYVQIRFVEHTSIFIKDNNVSDYASIFVTQLFSQHLSFCSWDVVVKFKYEKLFCMSRILRMLTNLVRVVRVISLRGCYALYLEIHSS